MEGGRKGRREEGKEGGRREEGRGREREEGREEGAWGGGNDLAGTCSSTNSLKCVPQLKQIAS